MAPVTKDSQYYGVCRISRGAFIKLAKATLHPAAVAERDPGEYWDACIAENVDPLFVKAKTNHESSDLKKGTATITKSWGNTRLPYFSTKPIGMTAPGEARSGLFPKWATYLDGLKSTVERLATDQYYYRYERRTIGQVYNDPVADNPNHKPAMSPAPRNRNAAGQIIRIEWAPAGDLNNPTGYLNTILAYMNKYMDQDIPIGGTVGMTVEERFASELRSMGFVVTNLHGKIPTNTRNPYRKIPGSYGGVEYVGVHWTGDAFSNDTIRIITGTNYNSGGKISEAMTMDDEIDMIKWYANYHISKDGGTWGGIAYPIMIFPSGRIYINWPFDTWTYHAFNANDDALAVCCPNSNKAPATQKQLVGLNAVLLWLTTQCPEILADHTKVYGHKELTMLDTRNAGTECPGVFLPTVQEFRRTGRETVPINPTNPLPNNSTTTDYAKDQAFKRKLITEMAASMPFQISGDIVREGWFNLSTPPAGIEVGDQHERWIAYKSFRLHTINQRVESFALEGVGSFEWFKNHGMLGEW